jgi:signal transduction histidine kinase
LVLAIFLEIFKMQIRARLTLQFLLIGGMIMIISSIAVYYSSAGVIRENFYNRLRDKARNTANLLFNTNKTDADRILKIESPADLPNEKIIIINLFNDIIYSTDEKSVIGIKNSIVEKVRTGYNVSYIQDLYKVIGILYYTHYDRFVIIAAAIDREGQMQLGRLEIILIIVCLFSLVLFFIAGWFYAGRAIKPISDVVKKVEEISITSLNLRVNEGNGTDEIGRLAKTFNKMLERLEKSFAMQKDFIANASHELRTPLTSINGQLQVLMMKDRSTEEYKSALSSVLDDIRSFIDLSNSLLLMARTSSEGQIKLNEHVRIDEILWQIQDEMKRFKNEFHINITISNTLTDSDQMTVAGDESMLKVALSNIIDNACKYSDDHSVDISLNNSGNNIEILFEDSGIGIPEEDVRKVFEPFYRGTNAVAIDGTGIGLPLVNQIIKSHNGSIKLTSSIGIGTKVIVHLPAAS